MCANVPSHPKVHEHVYQDLHHLPCVDKRVSSTSKHNMEVVKDMTNH